MTKKYVECVRDDRGNILGMFKVLCGDIKEATENACGYKYVQVVGGRPVQVFSDKEIFVLQ
jgi:hypothetical protein